MYCNVITHQAYDRCDSGVDDDVNRFLGAQHRSDCGIVVYVKQTA